MSAKTATKTATKKPRTTVSREQKDEAIAWVMQWRSDNGKDRGSAKAAAEHFGYSEQNVRNWVKAASGEPAESATTEPQQSCHKAAYSILARIGGWNIKKIVNEITGEVVEQSMPDEIEALVFSEPPEKLIREGKIYLHSTGSQIRVTLSLDDFAAKYFRPKP